MAPFQAFKVAKIKHKEFNSFENHFKHLSGQLTE